MNAKHGFHGNRNCLKKLICGKASKTLYLNCFYRSKMTPSQTSVGHFFRSLSCPSLQESTGQKMLKLNNTRIFMDVPHTETHKKTVATVSRLHIYNYSVTANTTSFVSYFFTPLEPSCQPSPKLTPLFVTSAPVFVSLCVSYMHTCSSIV